jgi:hypothetical protein
MSISITPLGLISVPTGHAKEAKASAKEAARDGNIRNVASQMIAISPVLSESAKVSVVSDVSSGAQRSVDIQVRDVNGDGLKDAVVTDKADGSTSALLNRGQSGVDNDPVNLAAPTKSDLDKLAVQGKKTSGVFLAVDLNGEGKRQFAVKDGEDWRSLGQEGDFLSTGPDGAGDPIDDAEQRFERLVAEFEWVIPAFALGEQPENGSGTPVGFVQMINGNVDPNPLRSFDLNEANLGGMVMSDSIGSSVGAFDPFGVGMMLYSDSSPSPSGSSAASASSGHVRTPGNTK